MADEVSQNIFAGITDPETLANVAEVERAAFEAEEPVGAGQSETLEILAVAGRLRLVAGSLQGEGQCNKKGVGVFKGKNNIPQTAVGTPFTLAVEQSSAMLEVNGQFFRGVGAQKGLTGIWHGVIV